MSYDIEIAAHREPTLARIQQWAAENGLSVVEEASPRSLVIERVGKRDNDHVCTLNGPHAAQPDDFTEELAAACLAPRWWLQVSVPYSVAKVNFKRARSLARYLAEHNDSAAFDPQEEALIWPRGRPKRVPPSAGEERINRIRLQWFLPPERWEAAPEILTRVLGRRCPEALPTRYGQWEPLQHRFDPRHPEEFHRFVLEAEGGDAFWLAKRPSFGGSCFGPQAQKWSKPHEGAIPHRTFRGRLRRTRHRDRGAMARDDSRTLPDGSG